MENLISLFAKKVEDGSVKIETVPALIKSKVKEKVKKEKAVKNK